MTSAYVAQYVKISTASLYIDTRDSISLWGGLAGYVAGILFMKLPGLSNNKVMQRLGMPRWKRLQRTAYLVFVLIIAHAWAFQILEAGQPVLMVSLAVLTLLVIGLQLAAFVLVKRPT